MACFIAVVSVRGKHWQEIKAAGARLNYFDMDPECFKGDRLKEKWKLLKKNPDAIPCDKMKKVFHEIEAGTKPVKTTTARASTTPRRRDTQQVSPSTSPPKVKSAPMSVKKPVKGNPYKSKSGSPPKPKKYAPSCVSFPSYYPGKCKVCKKPFRKGTMIHNVGNSECPLWAHKKCDIELVG